MVKNKQVDIIRAILAIIVIFYHYTYRFTELFNIETINFLLLDKFGIISVGCFYIITGFFIIPKKKEEYSLIKFLTKKILRIYPSYLLCITIIFISINLFGLQGRETNFIDYLLNVTMINGIIKTDYIDGAHWYLTYLIIFYIIIGLILKSKKKIEYFLIAWLILKTILKVVLILLPDISFLYRLIGGDYVEFLIIGIVLKKIIDTKNISKNKDLLIEYILLIFSFLITLIFHGLGVGISLSIFLIVFIFLLKKQIKNIKMFKPLLFIGNISFIIYLIHQNIGYQILLALYKLNNKFYLGYILITMIIIIGISFIIDRLFEKRVQKIIKEKILNKGEKLI